QYAKATADLHLGGSLTTQDLRIARLVVWPDADLAGSRNHARSTSGMWMELQSADGARSWPLMWHSKRQTATAGSTCEAEVISLAVSLRREALAMQDFLCQALGREVHMVVREDNTQCISAVERGMSAALRHLNRTQRISVSFLNEVLCGGHLGCTIEYAESSTHKGDLFTKTLSPTAFASALARIQMRATEQPVTPPPKGGVENKVGSRADKGESDRGRVSGRQNARAHPGTVGGRR
ncbi:MAG: Ty1/Copia family ribonuclease HI, partial [Pseudomonadota bacterium]